MKKPQAQKLRRTIRSAREVSRLASLAAVIATLAGCASIGPGAPPPAPAEVATIAPPQWFVPLPHDGRLVELSAWWAQFNDPLLVELIDSSQAVSPTIASAQSRIEQSRAARVAARAALLPTLSGFGAASRGNTTTGLPQAATTAQLGLQTAWEIDVFGANRQAANAAGIRLQSAQSGWHDARVSMAAETANSYIALRSCRQLLDVAVNDARSRSETARLTELTTRAGFSAPATAALSRASAAEGSSRVTQQRAACDIEVKTLVALTGMAEPVLQARLGSDAAIASTTQPAAPAAAPASPYTTAAMSGMPPIASLPATVLAQRPDVYQAELEVAAASYDAGAAYADRFPRLTLSGSVAAGAIRLGGENTRLDTWSIGPLQLTVPIFDGGRRAANVDAAQARYAEASALYAARVRQAVREVESALVDLNSARSRNEDARIAVEGYRASFNAIEARYKGGLGSLVELEDARRTALLSETNQVTLQREQISAWIALYRAAGGGWTRPQDDRPTASR
ncbi:efflux transporter outer membrane subunit [soil metagenome]